MCVVEPQLGDRPRQEEDIVVVASQREAVQAVPSSRLARRLAVAINIDLRLAVVEDGRVDMPLAGAACRAAERVAWSRVLAACGHADLGGRVPAGRVAVAQLEATRSERGVQGRACQACMQIRVPHTHAGRARG